MRGHGRVQRVTILDGSNCRVDSCTGPVAYDNCVSSFGGAHHSNSRAASSSSILAGQRDGVRSAVHDGDRFARHLRADLPVAVCHAGPDIAVDVCEQRVDQRRFVTGGTSASWPTDASAIMLMSATWS